MNVNKQEAGVIHIFAIIIVLLGLGILWIVRGWQQDLDNTKLDLMLVQHKIATLEAKIATLEAKTSR